VKTIVVGYDESESSQRALERAVELAQALDAKLIVTSVARVMAVAGRGEGGIDPTDSVEEHSDELAHARTFLAQVGVQADFLPAVGNPADAIVEAADTHAADLIVVGTREPGFLDRLLRGSVSADVARHAHCDVLIVH
jgi:nucleotide-binding universal stress UspA family protein